jgi:hypothetical protein
MKKKWGFFAVTVPIKTPNVGGLNQLTFWKLSGYVMASSRDEAFGMAVRIADVHCPADHARPTIGLIDPDLKPITDVSKASLVDNEGK